MHVPPRVCLHVHFMPFREATLQPLNYNLG